MDDKAPSAEKLRWVKARTYNSGFEAEMAVQTLESAGIPAHVRGNDIVGLFGPGFQGSTARGVDVMVLSSMLDEARDELD